MVSDVSVKGNTRKRTPCYNPYCTVYPNFVDAASHQSQISTSGPRRR